MGGTGPSRKRNRTRRQDERRTRTRYEAPDARSVSRSSRNRDRIRRQSRPRGAHPAWQDEPRPSRWPHDFRRSAEPDRRGPLPLSRDRTRLDTARSGSQRDHRRWRDYGGATPPASGRRNPVSSGIDSHAGGPQAPREFPAPRRRTAPLTAENEKGRFVASVRVRVRGLVLLVGSFLALRVEALPASARRPVVRVAHEEAAARDALGIVHA